MWCNQSLNFNTFAFSHPCYQHFLQVLDFTRDTCIYVVADIQKQTVRELTKLRFRVNIHGLQFIRRASKSLKPILVGIEEIPNLNVFFWMPCISRCNQRIYSIYWSFCAWEHSVQCAFQSRFCQSIHLSSSCTCSPQMCERSYWLLCMWGLHPTWCVCKSPLMR